MPTPAFPVRFSLTALLPTVVVICLFVAPVTMRCQTGLVPLAESEVAGAPAVTIDHGSTQDAVEALPEAPGEVAAGESTSRSYESAMQPPVDSLLGASMLDAAVAAQQNPPGTPGSPLPRTASPTDLVIVAGQTAPHQTTRDKVVSSLKDSISPYGIAGNLISAGYSHAIDSSPHYGVDGNAFAQRFGAAMARGTSQTIFTNGALAAILHEDTRYYQVGPGHPLVSRGWNAVKQPFIARTDGGRPTPNFALLGGYLGAAALTPTYYPPRDQSAGDVLTTWGTGVAGSIIGFAVDEFLPQILQAVHLQKLSRTGN